MTVSSAGFTFHDALVPSLPAGTYTVTTCHEIAGGGIDTGDYFTDPVTRTVDIRAPRFTIASESVQAVYPAPGASGRFDQLLPHVTLAQTSLPWARTVDGTQDGPPWLAVLLFGVGELTDDPEAVGHTTTRTVADLLQTPPSKAIPPRLSDIEPDLLATSCHTIDVPPEVFASVAPRTADLRLLAHLRLGDDQQRSVAALAARAAASSRRGSARPARTAAAADDQPPGLHAVVVGNRFPATEGGQYVAHLVSLEGFEDHLDGDTAGEPLRVVSLYSWSFRSLPDDDRHFGAVMAALAKPGATDPEALTLRLDPGNATGEAGARLARGYTPVEYGLSSGERTYAWYRGPLTPVKAQPLPGSVVHTRDADARLIYLEDYGVFDVSYAAAWTLGRTIALADAGFSASLMRWRGAAKQVLGRLLGAVPKPGHGSLAGRASLGMSARARLSRRARRDRFDELVRDGLGDRLATALREQPPRRLPPEPAPPGPPRPADLLRTHLSRPAVRDAVWEATTEQAAPVLGWLEDLAVLRPVPFNHLVPHPDLLPNESLRFGYVDREWVRALVDGALSIGVGTTADDILNELLTTALDQVPAEMSGFLVRSTLVAAWPTLIMHLTRNNADLTVLRADILAPDVLLVLADGFMDSFTVREPPQGLHFGYEDGDRVALRDLKDNPGAELNRNLDNFSSYLRSSQARVLDVAGLAGAFHTQLGQQTEPGGVTSGGLAIEMVKAAQQMSFDRP